MNASVGRRWPYLSPSDEAWTCIDGLCGDLRELIAFRDAPSGRRLADPPSVSETLKRLVWLHGRIEDEILGLVTEAHYRDTSWGEIADCLGRSKQSVHQRYSRRVHADATHERLAAELREAQRRRRYLEGRGETGRAR